MKISRQLPLDCNWRSLWPVTPWLPGCDLIPSEIILLSLMLTTTCFFECRAYSVRFVWYQHVCLLKRNSKIIPFLDIMFHATVNYQDKRPSSPGPRKNVRSTPPVDQPPVHCTSSSESSASSVSSEGEPVKQTKRHRVRFRNSLLYQVLKSPMSKKKQLTSKSQQTVS